MMKKNIVLAFVVCFLAACASMDPMVILKANTQVKEFLNQYPNADITLVKLAAANIADENPKVAEICGISLEEKSHYKATMRDPDSDLDIIAYIDLESREIVCLRKVGSTQPEKTLEKGEMKEGEKKQEQIGKEEMKDNNPDLPEECPQGIQLSGRIENEDVILEWTPYACKGFQGYKVVFSQENEDPRYPEDGYIEYITDPYKVKHIGGIKTETGHYGITVLTVQGSQYSNPISIVAAGFQPVGQQQVDYTPELTYAQTEDGLVLSWNKYPGEDLEYYKVVWSQDNGNLQYPDDGYIAVITDREKTEYKVEEQKEGYYRISVILKGFYPDKVESKRLNSNVVEIE